MPCLQWRWYTVRHQKADYPALPDLQGYRVYPDNQTPKMNPQAELDFIGITLRDMGIAQAVYNADRKVTNWSELAWQAFQRFIAGLHAGDSFKMEDFRNSNHGLQSPPNLRAYGFLPLKAARLKLIESVGTAKVSNPRAHQANANVWRKV